MAKRPLDLDNPDQMSLLDYIQQSQELRPEESSEGSLNIHTRFCHALTNAISASDLSRWEIAGRMSHLLGTEISVHMINAWTSQSKESHRIPAEYIPAFGAATESREPLQLLSEVGGMFCLPGPEALRAEIQRYGEEERKARAEKRKRERFLKEMEGKAQ
ncbi:MAG: hypothetical protein OET90_12200 [Desulfuromonadales bacterium]|nr:hypothetical protein [Desulfuromonadales bacterium]